MPERADLEMFLSKLTVLCREHGVWIDVNGTHLDRVIRKLSGYERHFVYVTERTPLAREDEWSSLHLVDPIAFAERKALMQDLEFCEADERYIRLLEAGLD
jgi:hypothetical protein